MLLFLSRLFTKVHCLCCVSVSQQSGTIVVPETATTPMSTVHIYWNEMPSELIVPAGNSAFQWTFVVAVDKDRPDYAKNDFDRAITLIYNNRSNELLANHTASFNQVGRLAGTVTSCTNVVVFGSWTYIKLCELYAIPVSST